ncbi:MAG TPA: ABC transporter permease [Candidatus Xenobia bacterium]
MNTRRLQLIPYLLLAPMAVYMVTFYLLPLFLILVDSLATKQPDASLVFSWNVAPYAEALRAQYFVVLLRSLSYAALCTTFCLLLGYPLAWYIAMHGGKRRSTLLLLIMLPFWTSYLIRTYAWIVLLRGHGVINEGLQALGLLHAPLQMLNTPFAVVLGLTYGFLPFMTLPIYVTLEKMDRRFLEASADLGASPFWGFVKVTWPLSLPGVMAGTVLTFIPSVGDFVTPELLGGTSTEMIGKVIMAQFMMADNWPLGSALSFLLLLLMMGGIVLYVRQGGGEL